MRLKWMFFSAVLMLFTACGNRGITLGNTEVIAYESLGNGVAEISLKLYENNTFLFQLNSIPQPEEGQKPIKINEIGTYVGDNSWKELHFKNQEFSLEAVFDAQFLEASEFEVIDNSTVKINTRSRTIPIWGVFCERKK